MIIGVCGFIGSGKDTIADYLVNSHGFRRESFANTLKDAVAAVFGWDRELLEGRTTQAREWREQVDPWWSNRLGIYDLTPRLVLQRWGTEVCRRGFHDDIWIASLEHRLLNAKDNIIISDCRFPNEIKAIKDAGGSVIWVQRGELPSWHIMADKANKGDILARTKLEKLGIHTSETAWVGTEFDQIIDNNKSLDYLFEQLNNFLQRQLDDSIIQ